MPNNSSGPSTKYSRAHNPGKPFLYHRSSISLEEHLFQASLVAYTLLSLNAFINLAGSLQQQLLETRGTEEKAAQVQEIFDRATLCFEVFHGLKEYDYATQLIMRFQFCKKEVHNLHRLGDLVFQESVMASISELKVILSKCFCTTSRHDMSACECAGTNSAAY
ncbi:hypothetical protein Q4I28_003303 [Leishmania naiffi]|uniref:Uncharacterized protein n=1 Tax=Leishmania naiffi TaxID=5678 RepID=A0AAW3BWN1_9TRYP